MRYRRLKRNVPIPKRKPKMGLTRYVCKNHGFLCDALTSGHTMVWCPCGRKGTATDQGEPRD